MIVCRYVSRDKAAMKAERLREQIESKLIELDNGIKIKKTCSIGYACYPFDIRKPESVGLDQTIDLADWCLYLVKNNGRNGWAGLQRSSNSIVKVDSLLSYMEQYIERGDLILESSCEINLSSD